MVTGRSVLLVFDKVTSLTVYDFYSENNITSLKVIEFLEFVKQRTISASLYTYRHYKID